MPDGNLSVRLSLWLNEKKVENELFALPLLLTLTFYFKCRTIGKHNTYFPAHTETHTHTL